MMATIKISDLHPAGDENLFTELAASEQEKLSGGLGVPCHDRPPGIWGAPCVARYPRPPILLPPVVWEVKIA